VKSKLSDPLMNEHKLELKLDRNLKSQKIFVFNEVLFVELFIKWSHPINVVDRL